MLTPAAGAEVWTAASGRAITHSCTCSAVAFTNPPLRFEPKTPGQAGKPQSAMHGSTRPKRESSSGMGQAAANSSVTAPAAIGPVPGPSQVLFDGRLLEPSVVEQQKRLNSTVKADEHPGGAQQGPGKCSKTINMGRAAASGKAPAEDLRPPMTPPRVSGISLAPLPDGCTDSASAPSATTSQAMTTGSSNQHHSSVTYVNHADRSSNHFDKNQGHTHRDRDHRESGAAVVAAHALGGRLKKQLSKGTVQHPKGEVLRAAVAAGLGQGQAGQEDLQLVAQGKSIPRVAVDPRLLMYQEINETDSLCGTPPALSISVTRGEQHNSVMGPLSPTPLSPSILTLCGDLGSLTFYSRELPDMSAWGQHLDALPNCGSPLAERFPLLECESPCMNSPTLAVKSSLTCSV